MELNENEIKYGIMKSEEAITKEEKVLDITYKMGAGAMIGAMVMMGVLAPSLKDKFAIKDAFDVLGYISVASIIKTTIHEKRIAKFQRNLCFYENSLKNDKEKSR